jgi:hypothetical protein
MRKLSFLLLLICLLGIVLASCAPATESVPQIPEKPTYYDVDYCDTDGAIYATEKILKGELAPYKDYNDYFMVSKHPGYEGGVFSNDEINPFDFNQPILRYTRLKPVLTRWGRQNFPESFKGYRFSSRGWNDPTLSHFSYHLFIDDRLNFILCSTWYAKDTGYLDIIDNDISWGKISWDDEELQKFLVTPRRSYENPEFVLSPALTGGYLLSQLKPSDLKMWLTGTNQTNLEFNSYVITKAKTDYGSVLGYKFNFHVGIEKIRPLVLKQVKDKLGIAKFNSIFHEQ